MRNCLSSPSSGRRIALPFLLFSGVLSSVMTLSFLLLLPSLTQVEVGGKLHDASHLQAYVSALEESVEEIASKRSALVTPLRDSLYGSLRETKYSRPPFLLLKSQIEQAASEAVIGRTDIVQIKRIRYLPEDRVVELQGSVRNIGPRSMTVLGEFVDVLKNLSLVSEIQLPKFVREEDSNGNIFSPFSFELLVR